LTTADQARVVAWIRAAIRTGSAVRVLLRLNRFGGLGPVDDTIDQAALWLRDDEAVQRMAIVGDARWKQQVLTIVAQPVRGIPIDYFDNEAAARTWLGGRDATAGGNR
jgi:hypothetical protein